MTSPPAPVSVGLRGLQGLLSVPPHAKGLVIFAHGSGSGRFSPRNNHVAAGLQAAGFATLLLDLLTPEEEAYRPNVFDIKLLATRLIETILWAGTHAVLAPLPIGLFGASTGAGAALLAAASIDERIRAIVSRGGRPDLAGNALNKVTAPTLLLVGSRDESVIELNRQALALMRCTKEMTIVPGASHLFEEPGTLDLVIRHAVRWFQAHLAGVKDAPTVHLPFADRRAAGRALAARLSSFKDSHPLILALPRGGVPVAFEVATRLRAELDLLLVRKLGALGHPELGIGAGVDGAHPQLVLNQEIVAQLAPHAGYIHEEMQRQIAEMERRRRVYLGDRAPAVIAGRTVIVVDDGVATGGTVKAALRGVRQAKPAQLILAVPLAPRETLAALASECDELICLACPEPFYAVGAHYADFAQTEDEEVIRLLAEARHATGSDT